MEKDKLWALIEEIEPEVIDIRRQIHKNPELALEEEDTAKLAAEKLSELGLEVETGVYGTGVTGLLEGGSGEKTVLLRADMDALPIQEETDLEFTSENPGIMHACGHDAHVAILLGTAAVLKEFEDQLPGNVKFVFQPAEEDIGGAEGMIEEGILDEPKVDAAFGLHVWGSVPKGKVEYKPGAFIASPDKFKIKIKGRGGHAARPHTCIDPVSIAAKVINQFETLASRQIDPLDSTVVSTCHLEAGRTHNVIPDEAFLEGTIRTLKPEIRDYIPEQMEKIVAKTASIYGADYEFNYERRFPPLSNDKEMTDLVCQAAEKMLGRDNVLEAEKANMVGEDFSYFSREVPSCFFFLGLAPEEGQDIQHHHPEFKVDDRVLKKGIAVLARTAFDFLN